MAVLITFPLSHFCEKARWALDHAGLSYRERGYPPVVHKRAVRRHGASTVPVLVGRRTLRDSTEILCFADRACPVERALFPGATAARGETDEFVARLDATLGPQARLWFYCWAAADPRRLNAWAGCGLAPHQRGVLRLLRAQIAAAICARMEIGEHTHEAVRERLDQELELVSAKLADGRRYLAGDSFGAADLTFAALAGPLLHPPGYGGMRLALPPMPEELAPQILAWRATPAGQHALLVYREHRARPAPRTDYDRTRPSSVARPSH